MHYIPLDLLELQTLMNALPTPVKMAEHVQMASTVTPVLVFWDTLGSIVAQVSSAMLRYFVRI